MKRLVQINFMDLEIGDYFSFEKGRPRDIVICQKTGEYLYKYVRRGFAPWTAEFNMRDAVLRVVWKRMAPPKHLRS